MVGPLTAGRYTYGKVTQVPGGPVVSGFEHQVTRQSQGLGPCILEFCHPLDLVGRVSTFDLVHPQAHARGALFLWPVRCDSMDYMILGRVRPRPEAGEGRPGRTYTQLNVAVFRGADWRDHAPEIVAAAPHWLRAEPDLENDFNPEDAPLLELPEPNGALSVDATPLPDLDDLTWTLLHGLDDSARPTRVGLGTGIRDEAAFCRTLGRALAILPPGLRILVTACAGFAAPRDEFAIQFIPDALQQTPDPTVGYLAQMTEGRHCATFADWRHLGEQAFGGLGETCPQAVWHSPREARDRAAHLLRCQARRLVIKALRRFLNGEIPRCPVLPTGPDATDLQPRVVALVAERLHHGVTANYPTQALARAAGVAAGLNGPQWTEAWVKAADKADQATRDGFLLWSALRSDANHDDPVRGIGVIPNFAALASIRCLTVLIGEYHQSAGLTDPKILHHGGLARRVDQLLARTPQILKANPFDLIHLAATLPDAFANHEVREAVLAGLRELLPALGLLAPESGAQASRHRALYEAAGKVLAASYRRDLPPPKATQNLWREQAQGLLPTIFAHCLETAIASHAEAARFWAQALACALLAGADVPEAVTALLDLVKTHDKTHQAITARAAAERLDAPFAEVFQRFTAAASNPAALAVAILDALSVQGLNLAAEPGGNRLRLALAKALQPALFGAIAKSDQLSLEQIIPSATKILADASAKSGESGAFAEFACEFGRRVLDQMVQLENRNRGAAIGLLTSLESLMSRSPAKGWAKGGGYGDLNDSNTWSIETNPHPSSAPVVRFGEPDKEAERRYRKLENDLAQILFQLILSWAKAPKPEPWFPLPQGKTLADCPIRRRLVKDMGFPWAIYFGRLGGPDYWTQCGKAPGTSTAPERRVMALCGLALWRENYASKDLSRQHQILTLLKSAGADEVLTGLDEIVSEADPGMLHPVGEDMVFLAHFFRLGGPQPRADTTPPGIRRVLLGTDIETDVRVSSLPLFLARGILTASVADVGINEMYRVRGVRNTPVLAIANGFRKALALSGGITGPILGRKATFDQLDDEAVAVRLDRILFGLNLLCVRTEHGAPGCHQRAPIPKEQFRAFSLNNGEEPRIKDFFKARPEYRHALERAIKLAGTPKLEGWPA